MNIKDNNANYTDEDEDYDAKMPSPKKMTGSSLKTSARKASPIKTRKERVDDIRYNARNSKTEFLNNMMDLFYLDSSSLTTKEIIAINNLLDEDDDCRAEVASELSKRKLDTLTK